MLLCSPVSNISPHLLPNKDWSIATKFLQVYDYGYHTGVDLNKNFENGVMRWNDDALKPLYAAMDSEVTFARNVGGSWNSLLVLKVACQEFLFFRYGHIANIRVKEGQQVRVGEHIANIGKSGGSFGNHHLHFEVITDKFVLQNPSRWHGGDERRARTLYVDPVQFYSSFNTYLATQE
jgi:murein DD-endopeptidase MepM/ murein hydrolase activator NlpD